METTAREQLLVSLETRFERNRRRHEGLAWADVLARLQAQPHKLAALDEMERSGGEPDVIGGASGEGVLTFCDCAPETPSGRRSLCYDRAALDARKTHKPQGSAVEMAARMGIALLTQAQYRVLQQHGEFDRKTSSWIDTPAAVRALGGALFCDRRYDQVFVYHNGAESYYAARGFRGWLQV